MEDFLADEAMDILVEVAKNDHLKDIIGAFKHGVRIRYIDPNDRNSKGIEIDYDDPDILEKFKEHPWDYKCLWDKDWNPIYRDSYKEGYMTKNECMANAMGYHQ